MILTLFMGHIKINGIHLPFKINASMCDNTNVMQTVDPDEQFNQSAVGIAVKYLSIVLWVERAITAFSLTLSPRQEKSCATLTLPRWRNTKIFSPCVWSLSLLVKKISSDTIMDFHGRHNIFKLFF